MVSYRDIPQEKVFGFLSDALDLLERHPIGPDCLEYIKAVRETDYSTGYSLLEKINGAETEEDLGSAVRKVTGPLLFVASVFKFHALSDTDGCGLDIYKGLMEMGALSGARCEGYTSLDAESGSYLICQYAQKVMEKQIVLKSLSQSAGSLGLRNVSESALETLDIILSLAQEGANEQQIKDVFLSVEFAPRYQMLMLAAMLTDLYPTSQNLPQSKVMSLYGLVVDSLKHPLTGSDPLANEMKEKVRDVVKPFRTTDEVDYTGIGLVSADKAGPLGIRFGSTLRAAEAVAKAFPDMKVVDWSGQQVVPPVASPVARIKPRRWNIDPNSP